MQTAWAAIKLLALLAFALYFAQPAAALQVTDDRGQLVSLPQAPRRIVSMLPSLTETACALGACDRIVGVDTYSNWPVQVRSLTRVGGLDDAQVETIVALKPDVVLLATSARVTGRLEALGIKVVSLEPRTLADVQRVTEVMATLLDVPDGGRLWRGIESGIAQAAASLPASARGTRVYFEVSSAPYAASESSFIGELLARLGAANVVPGALGPFPKLNPEFVVRADPEVIMVSDRGVQPLRQRPGWQRIRAVRDGRICNFSPAEGDVLVRAGPRMAEAAQLLARCLAAKGKP
jgi:iron complex transport system substrate-binding protein